MDIVTWGEDLAHQHGTFFSLKTYQEMLKPHHTEIFTQVKRQAPNAKVMFHCCGSVRPLILELNEAGADIIQSVQPLADGMDSFTLKKDFGSRVTFQGAIDVQQAMIGASRMSNGSENPAARSSPGGGYILTTSNNVQEDIPPENLVHLFRCAKDLGAVPPQNLNISTKNELSNAT